MTLELVVLCLSAVVGEILSTAVENDRCVAEQGLISYAARFMCRCLPVSDEGEKGCGEWRKWRSIAGEMSRDVMRE